MTPAVQKDAVKHLKKEFGFSFWNRPEITFRDVKYMLYPKDNILRLVERIPPAHARNNWYDCDDQADWFLAHLKNLSPGILGYYVKGIDKFGRKAHAWPVVMASSFECVHILFEDRPVTDGDMTIRKAFAKEDSGKWGLKAYPRIVKIRA